MVSSYFYNNYNDFLCFLLTFDLKELSSHNFFFFYGKKIGLWNDLFTMMRLLYDEVILKTQAQEKGEPVVRESYETHFVRVANTRRRHTTTLFALCKLKATTIPIFSPSKFSLYISLFALRPLHFCVNSQSILISFSSML